MRALKYITACIFAFLFLIWATNIRPWSFLTVYFPSFHILLLIITSLLLIPSIQEIIKRTFIRVMRNGFIFFPLLAFIITLTLTFVAFGGVPHIQDSIHYIIMAENIAHGQLHHDMYPFYEFIRFLYLIPDGTKMYSLFLPGFSFLLAPFTVLGIVFVVNPLLTAINIYIVGKIAARFFNQQVAVLTMIIAVFSTFIMFMGATFMAHPFCTLMTLLSVHFYFKAIDQEGRWSGVISGVALGWLVFTRPQNALFIFLFYAAHTLFYLKNRAIWKQGLLFSLGFLPFLITLLLYNNYYTGSVLEFKQDLYFNYSEPTDYCHHFGIGKGCHNSNWTVLPREGLTWTHALYVSFRRLSPLVINTHGHPYIFLFIILTFLFRRNRPKWLRNKLRLAGLFLFAFGGYFFFYFDGNVFGPRYLYEVTFFLIILMSTGIYELLERDYHIKNIPVFRIGVIAMFVTTILFSCAYIVPNLIKQYSNAFWGVDPNLKDIVAKHNVHNALVFIHSEDYYNSGMAIMRHDNYEKNDVLYVRDLGRESNSALINYYEGKRKAYKIKYPDGMVVLQEPELIPLKPAYSKDFIHIEFEDKHFPINGVPDYCNIYPGREELIEMQHIPLLPISFSKDGFFCRFKDEDEFYTFGQYFLLDAKYNMDFVGVRGPVMGRFEILLDNKQIGFIDFSHKEYEKHKANIVFSTTKGFHTITLKPVNRVVDGYSYFLFDFIEFYRKF